MAFDGRDYLGASLIYPGDYHPDAPMTGEVLAKALVAAYYQARKANRLVLQQNWPANFLDFDAAAAGYVIEQASYVVLTEGYAYLPGEVTHLVARVLYVAGTATAPTVRHKLTATDSPGGGSTTVSAEAPAQRISIAVGLPGRAGWGPDGAAQAGRVHVAEWVLSVKTLALPKRCKITLEAYAKYDGNNSAQPYKPGHVSIYWAIRET